MTGDSGTLLIRAEEPGDHRAVRAVHSLAFGNDQRIPSLVDALRVAPAPLEPISLVAEQDEQIVGHVLLSAARLDAPRRIVDVLTLSPLGVLPAQQGRGIATSPVSGALEAAAGRGVPLVFLEGSPRY
jgi:putative acetyltransferase